jgi:hypothetical protein
MTDNNSKFYILSVDLSKNIDAVLSHVTTTSMGQAMEVWGAAEFGTDLILGGGSQITSIAGDGLYVLSLDLSKNVERRSISIYLLVMTSAMQVWGAGQFGTSEILGEGSLITGSG